MKGFNALLFGICGTLAFSWLGLAFVPNLQFGHLEPQADEDLTDIYPMPKSGMAERGRQIYVANGCFYCHSQQVRADYAGSDIERKWGTRRSAPRDYIYDRPVLLGKERLGPDLANIGKRAPIEEESPAPNASPAANNAATSPAANATATPAGSPVPSAAAVAAAPPAAATKSASPAAAASPATPPVPAAAVAASPSAASAQDIAPTGEPKLYSAAWHHLHLYAPRQVSEDSNMPSYRFLYRERPIGGQTAVDALVLTGRVAPKPGYEVVPTYEAQCLVAYLMSLDQSHPLNEVKSTAPTAAASPAAAAPAKK